MMPLHDSSQYAADAMLNCKAKIPRKWSPQVGLYTNHKFALRIDVLTIRKIALCLGVLDGVNTEEIQSPHDR